MFRKVSKDKKIRMDKNMAKDLLTKLIEVLKEGDKRMGLQICLWNIDKKDFLREELYQSIEDWEAEYMLWLWTWLWIIDGDVPVISSAKKMIGFLDSKF